MRENDKSRNDRYGFYFHSLNRICSGTTEIERWIRENETSGNDRSRFHCISFPDSVQLFCCMRSGLVVCRKMVPFLDSFPLWWSCVYTFLFINNVHKYWNITIAKIMFALFPVALFWRILLMNLLSWQMLTCGLHEDRQVEIMISCLHLLKPVLRNLKPNVSNFNLRLS
jgi:hypothetical protein